MHSECRVSLMKGFFSGIQITDYSCGEKRQLHFNQQPYNIDFSHI